MQNRTLFVSAAFLFIITIVPGGVAQWGPQPCSMSIDETSVSSVMMVDEDYKFLNPLNDRSIFVSHGTEIYWACPGGQFNAPGYNVNGQVAKCRDRVFHNWQFQPITYKNLTCTLNDVTRPTLAEVYDAPNLLCDWGKTVQVGYNVNRQFVSVLEICFQLQDRIPLYTKYTLTKWTRWIQQHRPPPNQYHFFGDLIPPEVSKTYNNVKASFEKLGLSRYVNDTFTLIPGQLAANEEFLYPFQRDATYSLANVAPQWNSFDGGNWMVLEQSIITLISNGDIGSNATVFTGTLKVATLKDSNGIPVDLYLQDGRLPVPRWFWKLVYFAEIKAGAIFFGYNNIYDNKIKVDGEFFAEICHEDIFESIRGSWSLDSINNNWAPNGYIYACSLNTERIIDPVIRTRVENVLSEFGRKNVDICVKSIK